MASTKSNISASMGLESDKDLIRFIEKMNKSGVRNSQLVKDALRFYRDYKDKVEHYEKQSKVNLVDRDEIKDLIEQTVRNMNLAPVQYQQPTYQAPFNQFAQPQQGGFFPNGMSPQGANPQVGWGQAAPITPQIPIEALTEKIRLYEENDDDMDFSDME